MASGPARHLPRPTQFTTVELILHHVAHDFDATRHFLAGQVHPPIWFGNIVAGIVVWALVDVAWQWKLRAVYESWVHRMHLKALAEHHEKVVKPLMESQHAEHLAAISATRRVPATKKVVKKSPAKKSNPRKRNPR